MIYLKITLGNIVTKQLEALKLARERAVAWKTYGLKETSQNFLKLLILSYLLLNKEPTSRGLRGIQFLFRWWCKISRI